MNAGRHIPYASPAFALLAGSCNRGFRSAPVAPLILWLSIIASIAGCVPVPRGNDPLDLRFMTTDELREYSERVFRQHNGVVTRLMMAPPTDHEIAESAHRRIEKAESRMNTACASLNEIAAARASGRDVELELENRVRRTVRSCAESTRRLETLLDEHGIGRGTSR